MRCLVTGAAGFIGSNLVDRLLEDGNEVVAVDNESNDCHEEFHWNPKADNLKWDVNDYGKMEIATNGVDVVFHLAAESRIQPAIKNPIQTIETNVVGTTNLLQSCVKNKVNRFIFSSTSAIYGLNNEPPVNENMREDCLNAYSISKHSSEKLCKMFYEMYGLETISFRYFNVYGERQPTKGQYAPVIGLFQKQYEQNKPMTIVGDGKQRRDFTNIKDVVDANILAMKTKNKDIFGEVINIGTGVNYSIRDLVNMIDTQHPVEYIEKRDAEIGISLSNNEKANRLLGWKSQINLEDWICKWKQKRLKK